MDQTVDQDDFLFSTFHKCLQSVIFLSTTQHTNAATFLLLKTLLLFKGEGKITNKLLHICGKKIMIHPCHIFLFLASALV